MTHLLFIWALSALMAAVVVYDARHYIIPNHLNLLLAVLYVVACFLLPIAPAPALLAAAIVFVVGLGIFTVGLMGGGDVKLLAVCSLWAGWPGTGTLLVLTALFGGLLVLVIYPLRHVMPIFWLKIAPTRSLPKIFTHKEPVPYGLAIAAAFLWMLWTQHLPGLR